MTETFSLLSAVKRPVPEFMPMSLAEAGVAPDFVMVTGDAYVDHPSFGAALIGKVLWAAGYSVGMIARPSVNSPDDFKVFGKPNLAFLITSGNVDSMVNNYTAAKKPRSADSYSPGGKAGARPDRALTVYSRKVRELYPDSVIILGGIEASLRRLSHYDYWSNAVRKPVLVDALADMLVYGMGERPMLEIAGLLRKGVGIADITNINGTVYKNTGIPNINDAVTLPPHETLSKDRYAYVAAFKTKIVNNTAAGKILIEKCGKTYVVQNPPAKALSAAEADAVYGIRFARRQHPSYKADVPAIQEVRFSITAVRGCFGSCNFCSLAFHQGKGAVSRSEGSIVREAELLTKLDGFKGYIHDIGGPTANFYGVTCDNADKCGRQCLVPEPCKKLNPGHAGYLRVLRAVRGVKGVKKAFVRSGIRYDFLLADPSPCFLDELCEHHISGQLKVAPEHISDAVLTQMGKPARKVYERFVEKYRKTNRRLMKNQFIVPYLMSGHPGGGLKEAVELAEYLRDNNLSPEQVQDFYPTPGTVSSCMYHTGINPLTDEPVYVARTPQEKAMQRALIQYKLPQNYDLVYAALRSAGRMDLVGFGKKCLIKPKKKK